MLGVAGSVVSLLYLPLWKHICLIIDLTHASIGLTGGPVVGQFTNIDHPLIIGILSGTTNAGFNLVCGGPVMVEKISERLLKTGN